MGGLPTTATSVTLEGVCYNNCLNFILGRVGFWFVGWEGGLMSD